MMAAVVRVRDAEGMFIPARVLFDMTFCHTRFRKEVEIPNEEMFDSYRCDRRIEHHV